MKRLNQSNDWVIDKNTSVDHEDDDSFWDGSKKVKRTHKPGSNKYGHVILGENK